MNQADIMQAVIEGAKIGPNVWPDEALSRLASVIDRLEPISTSYERDMCDLLSVGACILQMQSEDHFQQTIFS